MKRTRKSARSPLGLWMDGAATATATWTTLAVRVPQLMAGTMTPAESHRMVAEKLGAAQEGALKASVAAGRVALRRPRRRSLAGLMADAAAIVEAAYAPAKRTVKANADRLSATKARKT